MFKNTLLYLFFSLFISAVAFTDNVKDLEKDSDYTASKEHENVIHKDPYHSTQKYHFKIQEKKFHFSSFFEIDSEDTYRGNIKKSRLRMRRCYDLSDKAGWCATGIKRFASLGLFFNSAAIIDVYGANDEWLGMIEGNILTLSKAKFSIYDREENLVGIAYMDLKGLGVTITPPDNEAYTLARLERVFVPDAADYWKAIVYEPEKLDDRLIRIFAAFCVDTQASFYRDN